MTVIAITANGDFTLMGPGISTLLADTHTVFVWGTFNDAVCKIQVTPDGTNWFDTDASLSTAGFRTILGRFQAIRLHVTAGISPVLSATAL